MPFPVDESRILEAEKQLGRRLPSGLRAHLLRSDGGEIEVAGDTWTLHPVRDPTDRKRMVRTINHIVRQTQQARAWHNFPPGAICIATNAYGDHLIVRAGSDEIELWDHETGECSPVTIEWT